MKGASWWVSKTEDGWRYRGDWHKGLRHGEGEVELSCGAAYRGR